MTDYEYLAIMLPGCSEAEEEQFCERVAIILEPDGINPDYNAVQCAREIALLGIISRRL